jgi:hypothetical protein
MKTRKALLIALFFILPLLFAAPQALAQRGCETGGGTVFDDWVVPHAHGNKFEGTLTIYYQKVCQEAQDCCVGNGGIGTKMFFVLRLSKKHDLYAFAGDAGSEVVCYIDMARQKDILFDFVQTHVLPEISPGSTHFALKAVDQVVDTHDAGSNYYFTMLDLTLVAQD